MRGGGGDPTDTVVLDLSTLRLPLALASSLFVAPGSNGDAASSFSSTSSSPSLPSFQEALSALAAEHGMRQLSEREAASACPFTHEAGPPPQREENEDENLDLDLDLDPLASCSTFVPIWQLLPRPLFAFEGQRAGARALASALSDREGVVGRLAREAVEEGARLREEAAARAKARAKEKEKMESV